MEVRKGIPQLSVMDVIAYLDELPGTAFRCAGPSPTSGEGTIWICSSPSGRLPGNHEVTVVGDDPLVIFSVTATARGLEDEEAAKFFAYVAHLSLAEIDPLNPEAWVRGNLRSGGRISAEGAALSLYGTKEVRTLQIVAGDFAKRD